MWHKIRTNFKIIKSESFKTTFNNIIFYKKYLQNKNKKGYEGEISGLEGIWSGSRKEEEAF